MGILEFFMLSVNTDFDLKTRHYCHTKAAQAGHVQAMAEERFLKIDGDEILKNDREFYN